MADQFIYCPQCGSDEIIEFDWEDSPEGDDPIQECDKCGWTGDAPELVCKDEE